MLQNPSIIAIAKVLSTLKNPSNYRYFGRRYKLIADVMQRVKDRIQKYPGL